MELYKVDGNIASAMLIEVLNKYVGVPQEVNIGIDDGPKLQRPGNSGPVLTVKDKKFNREVWQNNNG